MSPNVFRCAALASVVIPFMGSLLDVFAPELIPPGVAMAAEAESLPYFFHSWWFILCAAVLAVGMFAALVGLLIFAPWARSLALVTTAIGFAAYPFLGASVQSAASAALSELGATLWGATLAVAYFSPLQERFHPNISDRSEGGAGK